MERIGYIIRYNDNDEKGVLVYGYNIYKNNPQNKPINFSKSDCISEIKAGQFVYFDLDDNKATQIERASLSNFKRNIISEIVSCYDSDRWDSCRYKTYIAYRPEDLIDDSNHDKTCNELLSDSGKKKRRKGNMLDLDDDDFDCFGSLTDISRAEYEEQKAKKVDILDLEKWIDDEVLYNEHLYGITSEEVLDLFNLFVIKRRDSYKRFVNECVYSLVEQIYPYGKIDDSISPIWKLILAIVPKEDLKRICEKEPLLQPALPCEFCLENLDIMSIDYGFPDKSVCEAYYRYRINIVKLTTEYGFLSDKIYAANHCNAKHKENEGTYLCQIGKEVLNRLTDLLEHQYQTVVLNNVKQQLTLLSDNRINGEQRVSFLLNDGNLDYLASLGHFIDIYEYNCVLSKNDYSDTIRICYDCDYFDTIFTTLCIYRDLIDEDKVSLDSSVRRKFKECVMGIAKELYYDRKVYRLCSLINDYPQYLTSEDFETIKGMVNSEFSELDDLEKLDDAANCGLITAEQHLDRYKEITKNYDIEMLLGLLNDHLYHKNIPTSTQAYLIKQVFDKYDFKTLNSYHYVKVDFDTISNLRDLINWFNKECRYGYLNEQIFGDILKEITDRLSRDDRWQLFDAELIPSPGIDIIRDYLNEAYNQYRFENEYFRRDCFQDVMCADVLTTDDNKLKFMIAEHLDPKHQSELTSKCEGALKLYLWVINPDEKIDWNLITSYISELSAEKQIRLFRYIFYLIAKKSIKISVDELYKYFVESENKACQAVSGIVYILKEQLAPTGKTKSEKLDEIIGVGFRNIHKFLLSKTFFYPCNGHIALTQMKQDRDYHTYNGYIDKIVIQGKEYYSISFFDIPHDVCNLEVDWLDNTDILKAKAVLETNIEAKQIDGNYIIDISEEVAIKQFVMAFCIDDCCCLIDSKQAMIEKGYLPQNNSYQPLYTNYIRPYDDNSFDVCRCTNIVDVDSVDGIPFYWCNKKPCVRRCHYLLPLSEWEEYKLSDFIYILLGCETINLSKVWDMTSEISQFFNAYIESKRSKNESNESSAKEQLNTESNQIKKSNEIGVLTEELSVVQDIYDDDEEYDDYDDNYNDSSYFEDDKPTYERYNGSYAQDEMGYSDDDIDTIFDGAPSAYWNID